MIDREKGSKIPNEVKPTENVNKFTQSSLNIRPMQKDVLKNFFI